MRKHYILRRPSFSSDDPLEEVLLDLRKSFCGENIWRIWSSIVMSQCYCCN